MDEYAVPDDLDGWLSSDTPPDSTSVSVALRYATIAVGRACNRDLYTGDAEFPAPLVDATCAQAASWLALCIDPSKLGLDKAIVKKSSLLGGDVERDTSGQLAAYQDAVSCLCPAAMNILIAQNLLWQPVPLNGGEGLPDWGLGGCSWPFGVDVGDWPFI